MTELTDPVLLSKQAVDDASKVLGILSGEYRERQREVANEYEPRIRELRIALLKAEKARDIAIATATPDHPRHGERVYNMKKIYSSLGSRVIRKDRIEGELRTYRPGDDRPTYGYVEVGDLIVLPILKTGKVGNKPMRFEGEGWLPVARGDA